MYKMCFVCMNMNVNSKFMCKIPKMRKFVFFINKNRKIEIKPIYETLFKHKALLMHFEMIFKEMKKFTSEP